MTIAGDVERSLETTPTLPRDAAARTLALRYAQTLDDLFDALGGELSEEDAAAHARTIREIDAMGRRLEAMLDRLGMAPGARPIVPQTTNGGESDAAARAALERLRDGGASGAAAGIDYAAALDPAAAAALAAD